MPAWTISKQSDSTIIQTGTCPNTDCAKVFRIIYITTTIKNVEFDWNKDNKNNIINLRTAGGNMWNGECPYCHSTLLLSNS